MRIALTHAYSWPEVRRGAERILHELSRALSGRGHDVLVLTAGSRRSRTRADRVTTVRLRRRFRSDPKHEAYTAWAFLPELAMRDLDAVHSFGPQDAVASIRAARIRKRRTVYTNLGLPVRRFWDTGPARKSHQHVVDHIDVYGCMSNYALGLLPVEYGREGTLLPGGVNMQEFIPAAERESYPTILFSAALDQPHKGGKTLLEALAIVARSEPRVRLWLSGPGNARPLIEAAPTSVRDLVEVLPLGAAGDQAERYGRAWVTTLPSRGDSFGLVGIESLACGTPFAASNNAALPELITPGKTGTICDPDDPASVATALLEALELATRPEIVETCRSSVEHYDWETSIAPTFEQVYANV